MARRCDLDNLAVVKNGNAVRKGSDRKQIVGDIQNGNSKFTVERLKELQDFRLSNDIESAGRLVRDQKSGAMQDGHGNEYALRLSHAQLRRIAPEESALGRKGDIRQCFSDRLARCIA